MANDVLRLVEDGQGAYVRDGHALLNVKCSDSGEAYRLKVPHEHRYHPIGWGEAEAVEWDPDDEDEEAETAGLVVATGPRGITVRTASGRVVRIEHEAYRPMQKAVESKGRRPMGGGTSERRVKPSRNTGKKTTTGKRVLKSNERWITVHPNGPGTKGRPILISANPDGTHSVIGGAGGALNHLRLRNVMDQASDEAKEKAEKQKEKAKERRREKKEREEKRKAEQTPEEAEEEGITLEEAKLHKRVAERHVIEKVRDQLGGVDTDLKEDDLLGLSKGARNTLIARHHARQLRQAEKRLQAAMEERAAKKVQDRKAIIETRRAMEEESVVGDEVKQALTQELVARAEEQAMMREARASKARRRTGGKNISAEAARKAAEELETLTPREPQPEEQFDFASERMKQRAADAERKAQWLHEVAVGRADPVANTPWQEEALKKAKLDLGDNLLTEDEAQAVQVAAAVELRRSYRYDARAHRLAEVEQEDEGPNGQSKALRQLAWTDALGTMVQDAAEAKAAGLDVERVPIVEAEADALVELAAESAQLRERRREFREVKAALDDADYAAARRAVNMTVDSRPTEAALADADELIRREAARTLRGGIIDHNVGFTAEQANSHFQGLSDVALGIAGQRYLDRAGHEALGLANAAVLTRWALESDGHATDALREAIETEHVQTQVDQAMEAMAAAEEYVPGLSNMVENVDDIATTLAMVDLHESQIEEAQRHLGAALGRMESNATMVATLGNKLPDYLTLKDEDIGPSLMWLQAKGLTPDDYEVDYKEKTISIPRDSWEKLVDRVPEEEVQRRKKLASIKAGSMDEEGWLPAGFTRREASSFNDPDVGSPRVWRPMNLAGGVEPGAMEHVGRRLADGETPLQIQRDLLSPQIVHQVPEDQRGAYMDALKKALPVYSQGDPVKRADAQEKLDNIEAKIKAETERVAQRRQEINRAIEAAGIPDDFDREARNTGKKMRSERDELLAPLRKLERQREDAHREVRKHSERIVPFSENEDHFRQLAADAVGEEHTWHGRSINPQDKGTTEAVFRTAAERPELLAALVPEAERTHEQHRQIRDYLLDRWRETRRDTQAKYDESRKELGDRPTGGTLGMFGGDTDAAKEWDRKIKQLHQDYPRESLPERIEALGPDADPEQVAALRGAAQLQDSDWTQFVKMHGGLDNARQALNDEMTGEFLKELRTQYARTTGRPLRLRSKNIHNLENHLEAILPPDQLAEFRAQQASEREGLRGRTASGQYTYEGGQGAMKRKAEEARARGETVQLGLGGLTGSGRGLADRDIGEQPELRQELKLGETWSVGPRAHQELQSLASKLAPGFAGGSRPEVFPDLSMDGDRITQQRAVKMIVEGKRLGAWLGTGAGKSAISIGGFTEAHARGDAKHAWFVTPSTVQEQFGSEILTFTEPGKYRWATGSGKRHAERMDMLKDTNTHMKVLTHEAMRDSVLKSMADSMTDGDRDKLVQQLRTMTRGERAKAWARVMAEQGIEKPYVYADEAHRWSTRGQGSAESTIALVGQMISHPTNTTHVPFGTATPYKNDPSEQHSMMANVDPERFGDAEDFASNFAGSMYSPDAFRRSTDDLTYSSKIDPAGVDRHDTDNPRIEDGKKIAGSGPIQLDGEHKRRLDQVNELYERARQAREEGSVDVDAIRALSPYGFDGLDDDEALALARRKQPALGVMREGALKRALDQAPPETNQKVQAMTQVIEHDLEKGQWRHKDGTMRTGKPAIVFSASKRDVHMLRDHFEGRGHRVAVITGDVSSRDRDKIRKDYKAGRYDLLIATSAAEEGLNVQAAKAVHHYDVPLTAKSHAQRSGRAYRQGQKGDVDVHDWHTDADFEVRARQRLMRKSTLAGVHEGILPVMDETGIAARYHQTLARRRARMADGE